MVFLFKSLSKELGRQGFEGFISKFQNFARTWHYSTHSYKKDIKNPINMARIPPLKHARSFLLSLEGNILSDLQKIENTDFFGSRMNSVVENIIVDWIQRSRVRFKVRFKL